MRESDEAVLTRIDHCSRSVLYLQLIVRELEGKGVTFAATEQSIDPKTPEGKCFLNMFQFSANLRPRFGGRDRCLESRQTFISAREKFRLLM